MSLESTPKKIDKNVREESLEASGARFLSKELDRLPDSKRSGGFLLATLLAMGMGIAGAGKAEAQFRGGITGEIFQNGRISASQVLDRRRAQAEAKINQDFQKKLIEIDVQKRLLDQEFQAKRISLREYELQKRKLDIEVTRLSQQKDQKTRNPLGIKGRVLEGVIRGY